MVALYRRVEECGGEQGMIDKANRAMAITWEVRGL